MAPTLHLVRHAQGVHNTSVANHGVRDPPLTTLGEEQCRTLAATFPDMENVDCVVASPLMRTLYTALHAFAPVLEAKHLTVIALPELQETSDLPCDTGSAVEVLRMEFAGKPVDLSLVPVGWESKRMKWAPNATAIQKRAREARQWLRAREEREIVVVAHGALLHYLTEDWTGSDRFQGTGWANTEVRTYTFSNYEPEEAHLLETTESRQKRRSTGSGAGAELKRAVDR